MTKLINFEKEDIKAVCKFCSVFSYISGPYSMEVHGEEWIDLENVIAKETYIADFHQDGSDYPNAEKFFSVCVKGTKVWFFYSPSKSAQKEDEEFRFSYNDFINHGDICIQVEGTIIRWKANLLHAVIHLTDTISVTGNTIAQE